jgi:hypothetical protein
VNTAISGSRSFTDQRLVERVVQRLLDEGDTIVIGDAPAGVDLFAWAYLRNIHWATWNRHIADWDKVGRAAGHQRNGRMLDMADRLIAIFAPGERTPGTSDCVKQAFERGLPVHVFHEGSWSSERAMSEPER